MSLRNLEVKVEGTAGLLCSNVQYSDPLGDYCEQKQSFTGKKGKAKVPTFSDAFATQRPSGS